MPASATRTFKLDVPEAGTVTAKVDAPVRRSPGSPGLVLAHGANNDLDHPLLSYVGARLAADTGATVLRFNFPYVERGDKPAADSADLLLETYRCAYRRLVEEEASSDAPIFLGGKSLGGRTAAELVSRRPDGDGLKAAGLVELGYPLHAPGRTDRVNVKPLRHIDIPSLFCIGSRDPFCDLDLLRPLLPDLLAPAKLFVLAGGDHSLSPPRSQGPGPEAAYAQVTAEVAAFLTANRQAH